MTSTGKQIVNDFGEQTGVLIERSDVLIEMINARIKDIEEEANRQRQWADYYENRTMELIQTQWSQA